MLVLTVPYGRGVTIGDNIRVVAVSPHYDDSGVSDGIRIGIEAPREIAILRDNAGVRVPKVPRGESPSEGDGVNT